MAIRSNVKEHTGQRDALGRQSFDTVKPEYWTKVIEHTIHKVENVCVDVGIERFVINFVMPESVPLVSIFRTPVPKVPKAPSGTSGTPIVGDFTEKPRHFVRYSRSIIARQIGVYSQVLRRSATSFLGLDADPISISQDSHSTAYICRGIQP